MAIGRDDSFEEVERVARRLRERFDQVDQVIQDTEAAVKRGQVSAQRVEDNLKRAVARGASLGGATPGTGAAPTRPRGITPQQADQAVLRAAIRENLSLATRAMRSTINNIVEAEGRNFRVERRTADRGGGGRVSVLDRGLTLNEAQLMAQGAQNAETGGARYTAVPGLTAADTRAARERVIENARLRVRLEEEAAASQAAAKATEARAAAELSASRALQQIGFGGRTSSAGAANFRRIDLQGTTARRIPGTGYNPRFQGAQFYPGYPGPPNQPPLIGTPPSGWGPREMVVRDPNLYGRDTPGTRTGVGRPSIGRDDVRWVKDYTAAATRAAEATANLDSRIAQMRANLRESTTAFAENANVIRRHGALTAEWIQEAARGETTMRELGFQVGSTIGKFSGWIAAGAAVFATLDAFRALQKGAIDASTGVNQLRRVVFQSFSGNQVQEQFSGLAGHFNVPIEDATQAVYGMAKAFRGDLPQALESSRAVLYAVKVGELEVADATKFLTAITQGFGLSAGDLTSVFDQINQAQNRYGITIRDTLAGVAKSAGIFKAFGGNARESATQLIALITTISRASGQTGEVAGTALQRAPNFFRRPANQQALRKYGIDASKTINEVFSKALEVSPRLAGPERADLAKQLFGPQYGARVGVALLNNVSLYNRVLRDVSPVNARNSAERELQKTLQSISEQMRRVGIEFQRLGVELSRGGALTPLFGMVKGLTSALTLTRSLSQEFNQIPAPLRMSLGLALQMAVALRVLRRLRTGDVLANRFGPNTAAFFNPNEATYAARLERKGTRLYRSNLQDEVARSATAESRAGLQAILVGRQAQQDIANAERAFAAGAMSEADYLIESAEAEGRVNAAEKNALALARQRALITEELALASQANFNADAMLLAAREREATIGFGPNRKTRGRGRFVEGDPRNPQVTERGPGGLFVGGAATSRDPVYDRAGNLITDSGKTANVVVTDLAQDADRASRQAAATAAQAGRMKTAMFAARARMGVAIGAIGEMAGALGRFIFNPLVLALIGLEAIPRLIENEKRAEADAAKRMDFLATLQDSPRKQLQTLAANPPHGGSFLNEFSPFGQNTFQDQLALWLKARQDAVVRLQAQQRARQRHTAVPFRNVAAVAQDFEEAAAGYRDGRTSSVRLQAAYRKARQEIAQSAESMRGGKGDAEALQAAYRAVRLALLESARSNADIATSLRDATLPELAQALQDEAAQIPVFGATGTTLKVVNRQYAKAMELIADDPTADNLKSFAQIQQAMDQVTSELSNQLQQALALARSPSERNAAYQQYYRQLQQQPTGAGRLSHNRSQLKDARENYRQAQEAQHAATRDYRQQRAELRKMDDAFRPGKGTGAFEQSFGLDPGFGRGHDEAARQRLAEQRAQVDALKAKMKEQGVKTKRLGEEVKRREDALAAAEQEARDQQFDYNQQIATARGEIRAGRVDAGLPRIRAQIRQIGARIADAIKHYGRNSLQVLQLVNQQQSLRDNAVQEQFNLLQARNALREAGRNPAATQHAQLHDLYKNLRFQRRNPKQFSDADITQTQTQIKQLRYDMAQQVVQDASELVNAQFALKESRTTDPVKKARLELQKAQALLKYAKTPAEKLNAQAEINNQRRNLYDQVAQSRLDTINFEADIGKLTTDQEVSALKRLLRYHHLTRDMRRNILRQIYQLQHEGDQQLELNVGNVRLPTLYDVRRLARGGTAANRQTQVTQINNVNVQAHGASADDIALAFDKHAGTSLKSVLRSS